MRLLLKWWKEIFLCIAVFIGAIVLLFYREELLIYLHSECKTTYQNYKVEIISGLLFLIVPVIVIFFFGEKLKELQFYNNVENFLKTIRRLREKDLIKPSVARHLVKSATKNFGDEVLREKFAEKTLQKFQKEKGKLSERCKICDLEAELNGRKCKYCKLNCYAWDLNNEMEEKEIADLVNEKS